MNSACIHCDVVLTSHDLSEGWCETCGKRLPSTLIYGSRVTKREPIEVPSSSKSTFSICTFLLVALAVLAVGFLVVTALMGDPKSIAAFAKIGIRLAIVAVIMVPAALIRAIKSRIQN